MNHASIESVVVAHRLEEMANTGSSYPMENATSRDGRIMWDDEWQFPIFGAPIYCSCAHTYHIGINISTNEKGGLASLSSRCGFGM
jgi:hypothetical protein